MIRRGRGRREGSMKDTEDQFNETQTLQPFPPLSTIDRFENGGLPVQLVLDQQTLVLYRIFTKTLREECSGGVRRRAWVRFGLRQPVKKTTSTCDNLVWLTCTRRVHPASRRSQVLYRVCAPGNRHGAQVPRNRVPKVQKKKSTVTK